MIRVRYTRAGAEHALEVTGHAGFCPGNDVVCAGCSAVVLALLGYLRNAPEHVTALDEQIAEPGMARVRCTGDDCAAQAFRQAVIGLLQIQEGYPDYLQVAVRE